MLRRPPYKNCRLPSTRMCITRLGSCLDIMPLDDWTNKGTVRSRGSFCPLECSARSLTAVHDLLSVLHLSQTGNECRARGRTAADVRSKIKSQSGCKKVAGLPCVQKY